MALFTGLSLSAWGQTGHWSIVQQAPPFLIPHEECAFAHAGGKFYLMGGRGIQGVTYCGLIYVICAFDESLAGYPKETPALNIYIYDPLSVIWIKGPLIPAARQCGSAG